ncbi:MAG: hydroxyacid dehydrogenase [Candidatus Caldatribacterium sp.]|nr:hydroxyacid dehydrogenase [Candidatus Caldatribacterium sp.]
MGRESWYVLLPQPIEEAALKLLEGSGLPVVVAPDPSFSTVASLIQKARAIILRTGIKITRDLIERADDLWIISRTGTGVDNVDIQAATERGIIVTSNTGVNATTVAEHTLSLILALLKQLFLLDREVRKGNFGIRYKNYPQDVAGKVLGIVGFGRIGQILARYFYTMSLTRVLAYDPFLPEERKKEFIHFVSFVGLEEVFKNADIVSIHVPLNENTRNMISWKQLSLMKRRAYLVNVSRGGVVNEQDLVRALREGVIAGAGIDVFEQEPVDPGNPLLQMDNVILTPHAAALTKECVARMAIEAVRRVIALFNNYIPDNVVNPEVLKMEKWKHLRERSEGE